MARKAAELRNSARPDPSIGRAGRRPAAAYYRLVEAERNASISISASCTRGPATRVLSDGLATRGDGGAEARGKPTIDLFSSWPLSRAATARDAVDRRGCASAGTARTIGRPATRANVGLRRPALKEQSETLKALDNGKLKEHAQGARPAKMTGASPALAPRDPRRPHRDRCVAQWGPKQAPARPAVGVGNAKYDWYVANVELSQTLDDQIGCQARARSGSCFAAPGGLRTATPAIAPSRSRPYRTMAEAKTASFNDFWWRRAFGPDEPISRGAGGAKSIVPLEEPTSSRRHALDQALRRTRPLDRAARSSTNRGETDPPRPPCSNLRRPAEGLRTRWRRSACRGLYDDIPHGGAGVDHAATAASGLAASAPGQSDDLAQGASIRE